MHTTVESIFGQIFIRWVRYVMSVSTLCHKKRDHDKLNYNCPFTKISGTLANHVPISAISAADCR